MVEIALCYTRPRCGPRRAEPARITPKTVSMRLFNFVRATFGLLVIAACPVQGAELRIFGSRVTRMIVDGVGPQFERTTGHRLVVLTDVAATMKRRIESGEPFDLAVLVNFQTDALIKAGKLLADTRADVVKAGIGVAVRRGAPIPNIGTVEAFKQTLLSANRSPI